MAGAWVQTASRMPRTFAVILGVIAVICALAAIGGTWRHGVQPVRETIDTLLIPAPANLAYAAFLGVLAAATARRKRIAYWVLVGYFALAILSSAALLGLLFTVPDQELVDDAGEALFSTVDTVVLGGGLAVAVVALAALVVGRHAFYARVRKGNLGAAVGVFVAVALVGSLAGFVLVTVFPGSLRTAGDRLSYTVEKVLGGAVSFDITRHGATAGWVNLLLGLFGAVAVFAALFTLLRSQRAEASLAPADERRVRRLLVEHGEHDSLGYFATRRDRSAVFSPSGKGVLSYRVLHGVCLAGGDPIGARDAWGPAIDAWLDIARRHAWTAAVIGPSEDGATAYAHAGLKVMHIGDEAVLVPAEFTVDSEELRPVRQAVHRVTRAGYTASVRRHSEIPTGELALAAKLAAAWRDTGAERGFSMALGRLGDPADGHCVLVEARDRTDAIRAMLSFTPWGAHGLSLDLMRRDPGADNGTVELMVTTLMREAPRLGVDHVSLNFAAFRSVFEDRVGAGPFTRAWRRILLVMSHWWQMETLWRSNAKFAPHWVPRFLCFDERRTLLRVGLASVVAEGLVALPGSPTTQLYTPRTTEETAAVEVEVPAPVTHPPEFSRVRVAKTRLIPDPYPVGFRRTDTADEVTGKHRGLPPDTVTGDEVAVAGRVRHVRDHGHLLFATIRDWTGDLQLMLSADQPGADLDRWKSTVDIGDQVGVHGRVVTTHRGQLSVRVERWLVTAKALRPMPEHPTGGYLDLIGDPETRDRLRTRAALVRSLRDSFTRRGYLEAGPPTRLLVGGVDKVFQLDGTTLTAYEAYARTSDMRRLAQRVLHEATEQSDDRPTTLVDDFPAGAYPLAHRRPDDPARADRWALVADGVELASGYAMLTDPRALRRRLAAAETHDEDLVEPLEYALPPTATLTIHLDPLVARCGGN